MLHSKETAGKGSRRKEERAGDNDGIGVGGF